MARRAQVRAEPVPLISDILTVAQPPRRAVVRKPAALEHGIDDAHSLIAARLEVDQHLVAVFTRRGKAGVLVAGMLELRALS
jgi:hypothetical protein